jgi:N-acetylglucosamine kinase-like BadF-type ATPase
MSSIADNNAEIFSKKTKMSPKTTGRRRKRQKSHQLFLGVDGGGTKTHAVLIDEFGEIVGEGFSGASNPLRVGIERAVGNIFKAAENAADAAGRSRADIVAIECGLAGVRREDLRRSVRQRVSENYRIKDVGVVTDAEIALYAVNSGKAALVVIAGTGSICLGRNDKGETAIAGGWGPLAGDEGGGAGLARRALQAVAKAVDGRGNPTVLSRYATEYFRTSTPEDVMVAIYTPQTDNAKIAGFARFVVRAAKEKDKIALEILREGGAELGLAATAVIKKLKLQRKNLPIGFVGSIFRAGKLLTDSLMEVVHQTAPKAYTVEPKKSPAQAAAEMALRLFGGKEKNGV